MGLDKSKSDPVERAEGTSTCTKRVSRGRVPTLLMRLVTQSEHLAGHELSEVLSGPDPDPNKPTLVHKNSISLSRNEKIKVQKLDSSEAETTEDENIAIGSARNSFSQALKECQDRRLRSEILLKKTDRRRPASLDLNNSVNNAVNSSSPRLIMNKQSATSRKTNTFPSPGTPNYRQTSVGIQKGWSSERIPLHTNANKRNANNNTPLLPYNNGRTLPSKWEDAERWIFSPVSGDGAVRTSVQQTQRRPKSKSGPLGPPGLLTIKYEKYDGTEDGANNISRAVSRRDMATQMSPESSIQSSPRRHLSFSLATPSILPVVESQSMRSSKPEIRDVPVDERVTMTRWSKKNRGKTPGRGSQTLMTGKGKL
ncbi:hypothetical protein DH2020_035393 [Rehmannia glutinosa]|uniref:Uncharacterized protein n=1 Tax=Rehmannia glutinosa TaxID=99300 RepID=A0ABR0V8V1_REHGL